MTEARGHARGTSLRTILVLTIASIMSGVCWVAAIPATASSDVGQVVFSSTRVGDREIYSIVSNGSRIRRLTHRHGLDFSPSFSPDGRSVVFVGKTGMGDEIFTVRSDGGSVRQLTRSPIDDENPSYSPDGRTIVFDRGGDIWSMSAGGKGFRNLTRNGLGNQDPVFSPDGTRIAFASSRAELNKDFDICLMKRNGSRQSCNEKAGSVEVSPTFAPNGKRLAFTSGVSGSFRIYSTFPNGTQRRQLTSGPNDVSPSYAPDGRDIVFVRKGALYSTRASGGNARLIVRGVQAGVDWGRIPESGRS